MNSNKKKLSIPQIPQTVPYNLPLWQRLGYSSKEEYQKAKAKAEKKKPKGKYGIQSHRK